MVRRGSADAAAGGAAPALKRLSDADWMKSKKKLADNDEEAASRPATARSEQIGKTLRADLDAQQLRTFTRWWNSYLIDVNLEVHALLEDIKPGVVSGSSFAVS